MINIENFTISDEENLKLDQQLNQGDYPEKREYLKYIQRGFIILDKPSGPTSHDVIATVKKILEIDKAGHLGTLDPAVSGVLPIGLEDGTKILSLLAGSNKRYVCNLRLQEEVTPGKLKEVLNQFTGKIYQFPPVKSNVAMKLRKRTIYTINLLEQKECEYLLEIFCEAGTYIRTLCIDIGRVLGIPGKMKELRRVESASFDETVTITLHDLFDAYQDAREGITEEKLKQYVHPIETVLNSFPAIIIRNNAIDSIVNGAKLAVPGILAYKSFEADDQVQILTTKGELVAIGTALIRSLDLQTQQSGYVFQPTRVIFQRDEYPK